MFDNVLKLVSETKSVDEYGDTNIQTVEKSVFCEEKSIGMKEFYEAQASGLQPEIKFVIADYLDYSGEKVLKYQGFNDSTEKVYEIIRTYRSGNNLEITCKKVVE